MPPAAKPTLPCALVICTPRAVLVALLVVVVMVRPPRQCTINSGAACARIHWVGGLFDALIWPVLADLKHFGDLRRLLVVSDGLLLQLLAVSATAIMQLRDALKIRRWLFLFMKWQLTLLACPL